MATTTFKATTISTYRTLYVPAFTCLSYTRWHLDVIQSYKHSINLRASNTTSQQRRIEAEIFYFFRYFRMLSICLNFSMCGPFYNSNFIVKRSQLNKKLNNTTVCSTEPLAVVETINSLLSNYQQPLIKRKVLYSSSEGLIIHKSGDTSGFDNPTIIVWCIAEGVC